MRISDIDCVCKKYFLQVLTFLRCLDNITGQWFLEY